MAAWAAESRSASIAIQFLNSPDRPASAFSARADGIVEVVFGDAPQHLAQRIGLRDDVMVGEGLDLNVAGLFFRHEWSSLKPVSR